MLQCLLTFTLADIGVLVLSWKLGSMAHSSFKVFKLSSMAHSRYCLLHVFIRWILFSMANWTWLVDSCYCLFRVPLICHPCIEVFEFREFQFLLLCMAS